MSEEKEEQEASPKPALLLEEALENLQKCLSQYQEELSEVKKQRNEEAERRLQLEKKMEENIAAAKEKIKLEIGGKFFSISKAALLSVEGTFFHTMIGSGRWKPDEHGCYFIDRNPKHFQRILDYFRTGNLKTSDLSVDASRALQEDLDYYLIPPPDSSKSHESNSTKAQECFTMTTANSHTQALLNGPVKKFKLKFSGGAITFGFVEKSKWIGYDSIGWYYDVRNRQLSRDLRCGSDKSTTEYLLEAEYNPKLHHITFTVNGKSVLQCFQKVCPEEELYPVVCYDTGCITPLQE